MRFFYRIVLPLFFGGCAFPQTAFEVATIKPAETPTPAMIMSGKFHAGVTIDGSRADFGFLSLKDLIATAYGVKDYQVAGPDWIGSQRFDIVGRIPDGVAEDKVPEMLRALLAERFGLKEHTDKREHPIYALVQAKGGAKLKENTEPPAASDPKGADAPKPGEAVFSLGTGSGQMSVSAGRGGATLTTGAGAKIRMGMGPDGTMQMQASRIGMGALAEFLNRLVDRPVIDRTGLTGFYDVNLDLAISDLIRAAQASGAVPVSLGPPPPPPPGLGQAGGQAIGAAGASDPAGGSIFSAIQKLGLRLEPAKEPIDTIVVDHLEKSPVEN